MVARVGIDGGTPETLSSTIVGASGAFTLSDVPLLGGAGLIIVEDCDGSAPTVLPTGSPVPPDMMAGVSAGGTLSGVQVASLGNDNLDNITAGLDDAGSTVDVSQDGMLFGFVWEAGTTTPIDGAAIQCTGCDVYDGDGDASDGAYQTGGVLNTATSGAGFYVIPDAPISDYSVTATGYSFDTVNGGAIPNGGLFVIMYGQST